MKKKLPPPNQPLMPQTFPDDSIDVALLTAEAKRCNALAERWQASKPSNHKAYLHCMEMGWAFNLAAAWLRVLERGEIMLPPGFIRSPSGQILRKPTK